MIMIIRTVDPSLTHRMTKRIHLSWCGKHVLILILYYIIFLIEKNQA